MKMLFSYDSLCLFLLVLMQVTFNSSQEVSGMPGQNVTVPCRYSVEDGVMEMCWGRGDCPTSKCTKTIISSDGNRVNSEKLDKYGLFGNLQQGDVSLTILHASEEDSGTYCCRVEIPGWFNDLKNNIQLIIGKAPASTTSKPVTTAQRADTVNTSKGQITASFWNDTNSTSNHITSSHSNSTQMTTAQSKAPIAIGGSVMFLLLLLTVLCFLFIFKNKCLQKCQKLASKTIQELQIRATVDENIYIIRDQSDYQQCH
ncbi:hepatitis A virus cellular receptor 1 homolog [Polyodon spathula]|uniref:hepatitis A virus cellular receptor 1 homolog n=1 Tax=Polyodon spathula TaxID=7913 RepID=UPI001B7EE8F4|nr:hepatitis A virus cellular receptor 1 homolog [Polyodon spathula]